MDAIQRAADRGTYRAVYRGGQAPQSNQNSGAYNDCFVIALIVAGEASWRDEDLAIEGDRRHLPFLGWGSNLARSAHPATSATIDARLMPVIRA